MTTEQRESFSGWAIVELLGHRRLGGFVTEQEIAGCGMLRIDIPFPAGAATQFVNPSSLYALTPCTEEVAREIAAQAPQPVSTWDLRQLTDEMRSELRSEMEYALRREIRQEEQERIHSYPEQSIGV